MFKLTGFIITAFFLVTIIAPVYAGAETITVGMYGVPSIKSVKPDTYQNQLKKAGVNAVFVPDDEETIRWFKEKGYKVFISMNVFGGTGPWKKYPDSRPVKENGELLEEGHGGYGGICPTHEAWRKESLDHIESVLRRFGGSDGVDGIWLDFIRYPGMWEVVNPDIPDTCYCKRCLSKFYEDRGQGVKGSRRGQGEGRNNLEFRIENLEFNKTKDSQSRITNYELPITNYQSPITHHPSPITNYEWMVWKKKQIASFVIEAKRIIERYSKDRPIKLGLFIVPWTKGERQNDISFKIAQDAFELSKHVDVISPMVYHKMCGQDESWVRRMTEYYKETVSCEVWPIVQSHDCEQGEFANVVRYAGGAGADGVLVLSFGGMKPDLWNGLKAFKKPKNLFPDISRKGDTTKHSSQFTVHSSQQGEGEEDVHSSQFTVHSPAPNHSITQSLNHSSSITQRPITQSLLLLKTFEHYYVRDEFTRKSIDAVEITADYGREGKWEVALPKCRPGQEYLFTGLFYRDTFENGVYAHVSIWEQKFHINEHLWAGTFQPIRVYVTCPDILKDSTFKFINNNPGTTFYMAKPKLSKTVHGSQFTVHSSSPIAYSPLPIADHLSPITQNPINSANSINSTNSTFFPIGVYGANLNNLEEIKKIGINTVIVGGKGEELRKLIQECRRLDLKYILSVPHDPDELHVYLNEVIGAESGERRAESNQITQLLNHLITHQPSPVSHEQRTMGHLGFYVNDEPEIVSFPMNKAHDIQRLIKDRFPEAATYMAVVRPQKVRDYASASDFFMMDQYPVPSMPMVWLSDSMDEAAAIVGSERIVSVIQAFGGGEEAKHGWPRLPTRQEMECLTFLSIVHGGRGVFFFTFSEIGKTEEGKNDIAHVVGRLNKLGSWLTIENIIKTAAKGPKAVHSSQLAAHSSSAISYEPSAMSQDQEAGVEVGMLSPYGMDQKGRPAIHAAIKKKGNQWLLVAVNVIGTSVEALIHTNMEKIKAAREIFSDMQYGVISGAIQARFKPYEVKVFLVEKTSEYVNK
ncbi:MAG: beta-galactosidase [Proteobacteria bacterium]|nr:beta-galactosidase [Pseudomonadota bacterium]